MGYLSPCCYPQQARPSTRARICLGDSHTSFYLPKQGLSQGNFKRCVCLTYTWFLAEQQTGLGVHPLPWSMLTTLVRQVCLLGDPALSQVPPALL